MIPKLIINNSAGLLALIVSNNITVDNLESTLPHPSRASETKDIITHKIDL